VDRVAGLEKVFGQHVRHQPGGARLGRGREERRHRAQRYHHVDVAADRNRDQQQRHHAAQHLDLAAHQN